MNKMTIIFIISLILIVPSIARSEVYTLKHEECLDWLKSTPFQSKEQLLQLFLQGVRTGQTVKHPHMILEKSEIMKLSQKINTLFPLSETEEIEVIDSLLYLKFNSDQEVNVPGTWRQATLKFSSEVVFNVKPINDQIQGLIFEIEEGEVLLKFGWFAQKLKHMPSQMTGSLLKYWSLDSGNKSGITLREVNHYSTPDFSFSRQKYSYTLLPITSDFEPIKVEPNQAQWMGMKFRWQEPDSFWVNGKLELNARSVSQMQETYTKLMSQVDSVGNENPELILNNEIAYELEDHRFSLSKGFSIHKNEESTPKSNNDRAPN